MAPPLTILASSSEYVYLPVSALGTGAPLNPTADPVAFGFIPSPAGTGTPGTWYTGTWFVPVANTYYAACQIGPFGTGTVSLAPGIYTMWVRITDSPEVVIRTPGLIQIQLWPRRRNRPPRRPSRRGRRRR